MAGARIAWQPQPGPQTALITCPIEDLMYGGARGGGKTDGFIGKWLKRCAEYQRGLRGIFVRRTYDELDEVIARTQEIYPMIGGRWAAGKRTWYFPGGNRLKMRALMRDADASKYQGHSYTDVYIDEGGNFPTPDPLDKLRATLRNPYGIPATYNISANPGGPGHEWIKKRYVDPAPGGYEPITDDQSGEGRIYIPSRLQDNAILMDQDPHYQRRLKMSGPAWLVQAWLRGDWNATPEGGIIKAAWFRRHTAMPYEALQIVQSWDTAFKDKQINDPSVCTTWAVTRHGYFLLDVFRERMDYPTVKRAVQSKAQQYSADVVLIEDKGSGQSLIQELRETSLTPIVAVTPVADKVTRMLTVSAIFESGLVSIPETAPWLLEYEIELTTFPLAPHDDQVDSTSQFLAWAHRNSGAFVFDSTGSRIAVGAYDQTPAEIDEDHGFGRVKGRTDFGGF